MLRLTGKRRYRVAASGDLLILQVEEGEYFQTRHGMLPVPDATPIWRDARVEDMTEHDAVRIR